MRAIPRHKKIHLVNGSYRPMQRIRRYGLWNRFLFNQIMRQTSHRLTEAEYSNPVNNSLSPIRRVWITTPQFLKHQTRNENLKKRPAIPPPIRRHLLMGGRHQISARTGRQIADDRRFEVYAQFSTGSYHAQSTLSPRRIKPQGSLPPPSTQRSSAEPVLFYHNLPRP